MKASRSEPRVGVAMDKSADRGVAADEAPARDYFALFGLEPRFDVDENDLGARFRTLQQQLHPDRFTDCSAVEQRVAAGLSADVNAAHVTLRDPLRRARYLLARRGVDVDLLERQQPETGFLLRQLELREAIQDCDRQNPGAAVGLMAEIDGLHSATLAQLRQAFADGDDDAAGSVWIELLYIDKLRAEAQRAHATA